MSEPTIDESTGPGTELEHGDNPTLDIRLRVDVRKLGTKVLSGEKV